MKLNTWLGLLMLAVSFSVFADELVYEPVNPAFGGNPLNGDWLLANAQAQDDYDDPDLKSRQDKTAGELFNESLERALIRTVANEIADGVVDDALLDQPLDYGDFTVTISRVDDTTLEVTTYDEVNDVITVFSVSSVITDL